MYDKNRTPAGMAGVVIFDPEDKVSRWRFSSAAVPESIIAQFEDRNNMSASSRRSRRLPHIPPATFNSGGAAIFTSLLTSAHIQASQRATAVMLTPAL